MCGRYSPVIPILSQTSVNRKKVFPRLATNAAENLRIDLNSVLIYKVSTVQ